VQKSLSDLRRRVRGLLVPARGARRHLLPGLTLEEFFAELKARDVDYVVLRWFDSLPEVDEGEDIDLLVADDDLPVVRSFMTTRSGPQRTQKFDIYSVSGLPGSDFHGVPYYAPRFARELLDSSTWLRHRYRVPDLRHHWESLAYHAVYHKGRASGLSTGATDPDEVRSPSDHDYEAVLSDLAVQLDQPAHATLAALDDQLAARQLRPPLDTLERLEPTNPWIHDRFFADRPPVEDLWRGLAVFVLRDQAAAQVDVAVETLDRDGFEVLDVVELDPAQRSAASHRLRGGNWARGPWPRSGGTPHAFVIAYDVAPVIAEPDRERGTNQRIPQAKERLRARLMAGVAADELYNPVHSSDNPGQALDYLEILGDHTEHRLRPLVQQLVDATSFPYPVVRSLGGEARRARVALVDHPEHGLTVCKLFRPGAVRYLERELRAREEFGHLPEMPDLLERGDNWVLTTRYDDDRSHRRRRLPGREDAQLTRAAAHQLTRLARRLHDRGTFLLDLSAHNVVTDPVAGLKVLDLEFLQEYQGAAPALVDSYSFRGVPDGVAGYDDPRRTELTQRTGGSAFHPAVSGSSVEALLQAHRPFDAARRTVVLSWWYVRFLSRQRRRAARRAVTTSRPGRAARTVVRGVRERRRSR